MIKIFWDSVVPFMGLLLFFLKIFFCLRGIGFPLYREFTLLHNDPAAHCRIIVGDAGSNPGPLPQKSGVLPILNEPQHVHFYLATV